MKELARHIEVLLLENDCVIVPGLGGFIAHNKAAEFKDSANVFCPPVRTIGFNPQLIINDGLLAQSYMQAYDTDFPDASRKIESVVSQIKDSLYKNGQAELENIGTLYYTMAGVYGFEPYQNAFFSPSLYGLGSFSISPLSELKPVKETTVEPRIMIETVSSCEEDRKEKAKQRHIIKRMAEHAVGIAAAVILFFVLSVPVENTYLDNSSYASLGAETMLDAIRSKSMATTSLETKDIKQNNATNRRNNVNTLRPVAVKSVKVEKAEPKASKEVKVLPAVAKKEVIKAESVKAETKSTKEVQKSKSSQNKGMFIIVASLPTMQDAEKELAKFKKQGYEEATILTSDNRYRIALYSYTDKSKAYEKINELRKDEQFKTAWLLNKSK
ncbi:MULTISPECIES: SPOR domain-containing protein [Bacteroides]|uniref:HU domain-containing protein n=1 Tax=Bacteroides TaxID=816 RepID=UPI001F28CB8D|nr:MULTISPECIES: SPOR domain-containing protein [Bacteroides]MCF2737927.1 SPOR domain-containing protein [Bacteroides caecigallinarum]MCR8893843.1 SPOR domain-containing protein [Bacteroides sp. ET336]MDN0058340.1 SPOR domain-containing protein [Bacteroides caecigallinarum]